MGGGGFGFGFGCGGGGGGGGCGGGGGDLHDDDGDLVVVVEAVVAPAHILVAPASLYSKVSHFALMDHRGVLGLES